MINYFKTPQISFAAVAAHDILVNFEISLAVFIANTSRNRAISYTNTNYCSGWFFRYCLLIGAVKQKSKDLDRAGSLQSYSSVIKIGAMRLPKHPCLSLTFLAGWSFSSSYNTIIV